MSSISVKQAAESDIPILESILLDSVIWVSEMGQPLWNAEDVVWGELSKSYQADDFYIAYADGIPSGCMVLLDYDPFFWPDVKMGESLFIHKLAVTKTARKSGVSDALMDFFKEQGISRGVKTLRLDTDALRPKTRAFYERHGFGFVEEKVMGKFHVAFYIYTLSNSTHNVFVYGTGNPAKLQSMRDCLAPLDIEIIGLKETGIIIPNVDENGNTPLDNARIKALAYYAALKRPVFACDSGLYIDGLPDDEQPSVHVRLVNGKRLSDDEMIMHYSAIAGKLGGKAVARYKNAICLIISEDEIYELSATIYPAKRFVSSISRTQSA